MEIMPADASRWGRNVQATYSEIKFREHKFFLIQYIIPNIFDKVDRIN